MLGLLDLLFAYSLPDLEISFGARLALSVSTVLTIVILVAGIVVFLGSVVASASMPMRLLAAALLLLLGLLTFPGFLILLNLAYPDLGTNLGTQTIAVVGAVTSALLALFGVLVSQVVNAYTTWSQRRVEREGAQEQALQDYLADKGLGAFVAVWSEPVEGRESTKEPGSHETVPSYGDQAIMSAKANSLFLRLDANRKKVLLQFLHGAKLLAYDRKDQAANGSGDEQPEGGGVEKPAADTTSSSTARAQSGDVEEGTPKEGNGTGQAPPFVTLSGADLYGLDLASIDLCGDSLQGVNLKCANLKGATLIGVDLSQADLKGADLRDSDLSGANLSDADLQGADLSGANLRGTNLRGADLGKLGWLDVRAPNLVRIYLRGWEESNTPGSTNLKDIDFTGADLRGADLTGANGIKTEELARAAKSIKGVIMPDGSKYDK